MMVVWHALCTWEEQHGHHQTHHFWEINVLMYMTYSVKKQLAAALYLVFHTLKVTLEYRKPQGWFRPPAGIHAHKYMYVHVHDMHAKIMDNVTHKFLFITKATCIHSLHMCVCIYVYT